MFIEPNTYVRLLRNVPLDVTYRNTLYFDTAPQQKAYFDTMFKVAFGQQSYQRVNKGSLRVARKADDLYDCNYLMFQNASFGDKWFYAFIQSVEYVNNETTEIKYTLDVMQTWFFDYRLRASFVEREMAISDRIGANLVPENLEFGEYIYKDLGLSGLFNLYSIVVAATFDEALEDAIGGMYGGVFSGLHYNVFNDFTSASAFLAKATEQNKSSGIVSIFMIPTAFTSKFQETIPGSFELERDKNLTTIDGYKPKNNKLFTYPYNMLYVTNNEGMTANYPFEYFSEPICKFKISGAMCCTPEVMLAPVNYKGVPVNYNEKLTMGNFPQCAYIVDTFKAWVAQNQNQLSLSAVNSVGSIALGGATMYASGGLIGGNQVASGFQDIGNIVASLADKSTLPPQARGGGGSIINMANKIKGYQFYYAHIRREFAQIIDEYFNVYGYASHRVTIPSRSSRPHWNYIKTVNVNLVGSVPSDDMAKLRSIYDTGVTFWKKGAEVGNYYLDNSINV